MSKKEKSNTRGDTWSGIRPAIFSDKRDVVTKGASYKESDLIFFDDLNDKLKNVAESAIQEKKAFEDKSIMELVLDDKFCELREKLKNDNITIE